MPRVPLSWLGEWVELPVGVQAEAIAADLVRVGLEEEAIHLPEIHGPLVVGRVVAMDAEPQKNGKTINWCQVEVGEHNADGVPRGIVCGAHNFVPGDLVVVALPGSQLPGPFPITSRKTYGHTSDGMICSARELGLGDDHDGIIVLADLGVTTQNGYEASVLEPGADAISLLGLGDSVVEINVTPDRGYCFAVRGVAREYSHATGAKFTDRTAIDTPIPTDDGPVIEIEDDGPMRGRLGCDRFAARIVRNIAQTESPAWMKRRLAQAGMRPISLAVDVTNYVMLEFGQPMHAYDLAQTRGAIIVRRAAKGEKLTTLDGVLRELNVEDLLITDSGTEGGTPASRVLGLAGVMGGSSTEVGETTTELLLEAAHFDPVTVARTSRRHRLTSEASRRFERGVDPGLPAVAIQRAVELLVQYGHGEPDIAVTDVDRRGEPTVIALDPAFPGRRVGVDYSTAAVREILERIGCTIESAGDQLLVTAPSWRPDLTEQVNLVEEIARLDGYEKIPSLLPIAPAGNGLTSDQRHRALISRALAEFGYVEVLSSPFVASSIHDDLLLEPHDPRRIAVRLLNPLSETEPELRTSLMASLVSTAHRNAARGMEDFAIFEVGTVAVNGVPGSAPTWHPGIHPTKDEIATVMAAVPEQPLRVAGIAAGAWEYDGWWGSGRSIDYSDAVAAAIRVTDRLGLSVSVVAATYAPWHPGRCARLQLDDGTILGHAGELHPQALKNVELPARAVGFELDLTTIFARGGAIHSATPISTFPVAKEDIALVVDVDTPAADLLTAVRVGAGELLESVRVFDSFAGEQVGPGRKSVAFALRLRAADRTLTAADASAVREAVVSEAASRFGASLRA